MQLWLRYVDDTFTAVQKDEIDAFYNHLHEQNADTLFTREIELNGKRPFSDCLVSHDNNHQCTGNQRIPTDNSTNHPTTHFTQSYGHKDFDELSATTL